MKEKGAKQRKLTPAEEKRLERFNAMADQMQREGYAMRPLTVSALKANIVAVAAFVPALVLGVWLYFVKNGADSMDFQYTLGTMCFLLVGLVVLTVVHELVHGLAWSLFTPHHWGDIAFGFVKEYLMPYCACAMPLRKTHYLIGALAPLVLVGIVPAVIGILIGSFALMLLGVVMISGAGGDMIISWRILRYRTDKRELVYIDHPTEAGGVVFER